MQYLTAYRHFKRAIDYNISSAYFYNEAANMAGNLGKHHQKQLWLQEALSLLQQQSNIDPMQLSAVTGNLAGAYLFQDKSVWNYWRRPKHGLSLCRRCLRSEQIRYGVGHW